ncbi:hypothetical protein HDU76_007275 [Blyttiomyces sp. JEL0837]|nr:hypothetical protein HDU76_007275 [Blyttiomyces sp. JEL0837]
MSNNRLIDSATLEFPSSSSLSSTAAAGAPSSRKRRLPQPPLHSAGSRNKRQCRELPFPLLIAGNELSQLRDQRQSLYQANASSLDQAVTSVIASLNEKSFSQLEGFVSSSRFIYLLLPDYQGGARLSDRVCHAIPTGLVSAANRFTAFQIIKFENSRDASNGMSKPSDSHEDCNKQAGGIRRT